jgi:opacity protein-like surface antigen
MNKSRSFTAVNRTITTALNLRVKRLWLLVVLIGACASAVSAQGTDDYNKVELYGGYSLGRMESSTSSLSFVDPGGGTTTFSNLCSPETGEVLGLNSQKFFCKRRTFNGFDASITYNMTKYIGIKADVTGHFKSDEFVDVFTPPGVTQTISTKERLYNFLGGIQVKNNSKRARFKPFAHALFGAARLTSRQEQTLDLFPQFNFTAEDRETSFAMKLGGGLDVRVGRRVDVRLFELDYNPMFAGDRSYETIAGPFTFTSTGRTAHNFTFGVGIVIH